MHADRLPPSHRKLIHFRTYQRSQKTTSLEIRETSQSTKYKRPKECHDDDSGGRAEQPLVQQRSVFQRGRCQDFSGSSGDRARFLKAIGERIRKFAAGENEFASGCLSSRPPLRSHTPADWSSTAVNLFALVFGWIEITFTFPRSRPHFPPRDRLHLQRSRPSRSADILLASPGPDSLLTRQSPLPRRVPGWKFAEYSEPSGVPDRDRHGPARGPRGNASVLIPQLRRSQHLFANSRGTVPP